MWALLLMLAFAAARLWIAGSGQLDLAQDEAQYWDWSRRGFALSYYSKGPLIAWIIAAGTKLFGDTELGVRLFAVLNNLAVQALLYGWLGVLLRRPRLAVVTLCIANTAPLFIVSGVLMTTDSPLLLCWIAGLFCLTAVTERPHASWPFWGLGAAVCLGVLAKYAMLAFVILALIYAWRLRGRDMLPPHRMRPLVLALALGAGLGFLPILVWNAGNGFVAFRHVAGLAAKSGGPSAPWADLPEYLGAQAGLLLPWWLGFMLWHGWRLMALCRAFPGPILPRGGRGHEDGPPAGKGGFFSRRRGGAGGKGGKPPRAWRVHAGGARHSDFSGAGGFADGKENPDAQGLADAEGRVLKERGAVASARDWSVHQGGARRGAGLEKRAGRGGESFEDSAGRAFPGGPPRAAEARGLAGEGHCGDESAAPEADYRFYLLLCLGFWPLWLFFLFWSASSRVYPNWPAMSYATGLVIAALGVERLWEAARRGRLRKPWTGKPLIIACVALSLFVCLGIHGQRALTALLPLPESLNPTVRLKGWSELGKDLDRVRQSMPDPGAVFFFSDAYDVAAALAFYLPGHPVVYCADFGRRANQYDLWPDPNGEKPALNFFHPSDEDRHEGDKSAAVVRGTPWRHPEAFLADRPEATPDAIYVTRKPMKAPPRQLAEMFRDASAPPVALQTVHQGQKGRKFGYMPLYGFTGVWPKPRWERF